jgi:hypothetical protein
MNQDVPLNRAQRRARGRPLGSRTNPALLSLKRSRSQATGTTASDPDSAPEVGDADGGLSPLEAAPDRAPRDRRVSSGKRRSAAGQKIVEGFAGIYVLVGGVVMAFNQYDGLVIVQKAQSMAVALEQTARHNPELYKILVRLSGATDFTALFMSYGAVGYAIAANHGAVPARPVAMFDLPLPPERTPSEEQPNNATAWGPLATPEASVPPVMPNIPEEQYTPPANGIVGLHGADAATFARIRQESIDKALALQAQAAAQGDEGMPTVNPRGGI